MPCGRSTRAFPEGCEALKGRTAALMDSLESRRDRVASLASGTGPSLSAPREDTRDAEPVRSSWSSFHIDVDAHRRAVDYETGLRNTSRNN